MDTQLHEGERQPENVSPSGGLEQDVVTASPRPIESQVGAGLTGAIGGDPQGEPPQPGAPRRHRSRQHRSSSGRDREHSQGSTAGSRSQSSRSRSAPTEGIEPQRQRQRQRKRIITDPFKYRVHQFKKIWKQVQAGFRWFTIVLILCVIIWFVLLRSGEAPLAVPLV